MSLAAGTRLGPFEVTALVGEGGMGAVYRARDTKLDRDVALKILPESFANDPDRLMRFEREAKTLASLNHPHIAQIYGLEQSGAAPALVMELVEGEDLSQRISRGPIPIDEALPIAKQIAEALEAAHEGGIIHRDLKPANVKVRSDGTVKVLDFGLAKATESAARSSSNVSRSPTITVAGTREGVILGTAAYMSPEQARGQIVDKRTDIWAFGCVLYEMLAGRAAFARETVSDTIVAILEREPDWDLLPRMTPVTIRAVVKRSVEKDPRRRLRDIGDARFQLEDTRVAPHEGAISEQNGSNARRWRLAAFASLGGLLVTGIFAVSPRLWLPSGQESIAAGAAVQLTNLGGAEASGALSPDGRSFVFVSNHGGTPDIWLRQISGGEPVRLTTDDAEERDLVYSADGESVYFTRADSNVSSIWRIGALGGTAQKVMTDALLPAPSPDGLSLAYYEPGDDAWALVVSALDGSDKRVLVRGLIRARANPRPAWSTDGRWISYCRSGLFAASNLFVVDVTSGQSRQVTRFTRSLEGVAASAWLPDNRHLIVSYQPTSRQQAPMDLGILDVQGGSIRRLTMSVRDSLQEPSISRDGSRIVVTSVQWRRELWRVPLDSDPDTNGRNAIRLLDSRWGPMWIFLSRDGGTLLFNSATSGGYNLWTMPVGGGERPRQITALPGSVISHASLSPDGSHVAFASNATGNSKIWTQSVDGSGLRQLTNDENADSWPVWSPDGQWIVFRSDRDNQRQETWRIHSKGGTPEKLFDNVFRGDWVRQPGDNNAGTWIATMGGDGLRLLDVERRTEIWRKPFPGEAASNPNPVFSPDSRSISVVVRANRDQDAVWIFDAATGSSRLAAVLPFHASFRAAWADDGRSLVVNRDERLSNVVMFERFWEQR